MPLRRLILHAGPHKTGTSAIQQQLRDKQFNRFYYPRTGQWHDGAHHGLVFSIIPELRRDDGIDVLEPNILLEEMIDELSGINQDTLLISSEYLSLGCAARVVSWLALNELITTDGMRALLVFRDELSRAASLYNQAVKDPYVGETRNPEQWLREERSKLSIAPMITSLNKLCAEVDVVSYDPAETLVKRLLQTAGAMQAELDDDSNWTNISMSAPALFEMLEVNRSTTDPEVRLKMRAEILARVHPAFTISDPVIFNLIEDTSKNR